MALTSRTPGGLRLASHFLVSLSLLGGTAIASTYQAPAGEMNGLLDAVLTVEGNGRMLWASGTAAFFPKDAHYDGSPEYVESKRCFLTLDYKGQETGRWQLLVNGDETVFQRFQGYGSLPTPIVREEGEYELAYELDGEAITSTTFSVMAKGSGDPFNPATTYTVDAPLLHMAQLREDVNSSQGGLSAVFFLHRDDLGLDKGTRAQVAIEQNGRSLFSGGEISASNGGANGHWFRCDKGIRYGKEKGGGFLELARSIHEMKPPARPNGAVAASDEGLRPSPASRVRSWMLTGPTGPPPRHSRIFLATAPFGRTGDSLS